MMSHRYTAGIVGLLYLLNISEFVYFVCGLSVPKRRVVRRRNFGRQTLTHTDYVQDVLGFMYIGVVVTKIIMTFFHKCGAVTSGRSVRPQALHHPAGWLAATARWPARVT